MKTLVFLFILLLYFDGEVEEFLRADAELLKLREPVPGANIYDFSLQQELYQELGIK